MDFFFSSGDRSERSVKFYEEAHTIFQGSRNKKALAEDYQKMGLMSLIRTGNVKKAVEYHNMSLHIHQELGDKKALAEDYNNLGLVLQNVLDDATNVKKAVEYHNMSLHIHQELGDKKALAEDYRNIGSLLFVNGFFLASIEYFNQSKTIDLEMKDKKALAEDYNNLGLAYHALNQLEKSEKYFQESFRIYDEMNADFYKADLFNNIGAIYWSLGNKYFQNSKDRFETAIEKHMNALKIHEVLENKIRCAIDYYDLARITFRLKKYSESKMLFIKSKDAIISQSIKTGHTYPLIEQIEDNILILNKNKTKIKESIVINKRKFFTNQIAWWGLTLASSLGISFLFPYPISIPFMIGLTVWISFLWRKNQIKKMGISKRDFQFSKNYSRHFLLADLKTIGIGFGVSFSINYLISYLNLMVYQIGLGFLNDPNLLFGISLSLGLGTAIMINYFRMKKITKRLALITSYRKFYQKPVSIIFDPSMNI